MRPQSSRLVDCLGDGDVRLLAMPVVSLGDGAVVGVEMLTRWHTLDGRVLLPAEFLPRVDDAGLCVDLDQVVLATALDAVGTLPERVGIGVNLSAASLSRPDLADWLLGGLDRSGLAPSRLQLELTESSVLPVDAHVTAAMQEVASTGVQWWLDDFGTGYSSISHLRDLPITGMKLDRSFTAGVTDRRTRNARLALGLVRLAGGLGLDTVAEGVETPQQAQLLAEQGWQMGQGWLFGAAAEVSALEWT